MNKQLGIFALAVVSVMLLTSFVFAFPGGSGFDSDLTDEEKAEREAFRESLHEAIENDDYDAWKDLMESQLTQERFDSLREKHEQRSEVRELMEELKEAREAGDEDRVEELREELSELRTDRENGENNHQRDHRKARGLFQRMKGYFQN